MEPSIVATAQGMYRPKDQPKRLNACCEGFPIVRQNNKQSQEDHGFIGGNDDQQALEPMSVLDPWIGSQEPGKYHTPSPAVNGYLTHKKSLDPLIARNPKD